MVESKPFKTKLCVLYHRGRCVREEACTFAHGDTELRGFSSSFNDKRINKDNDLRSKLDRKRSPLHRSPRRDAEGFCAFKRSSSSGPLHTSKRRKTKTHEPINGPNDFSGGVKSQQGSENSRKDEKLVFLKSQKMLDDEVKKIHNEVDMLRNEKHQLEIEMEERVQEANSLSSGIRDLEAQLSKETENIKRFNSKIKQFIRAHAHHCQLNDEIKRSQVRFEQLVGELGVNARQMGAGEDTLNVNVVIDEDVLNLKKYTSPARKQLPNSREATQKSKSENMLGHEVRFAGSKRNHFDGRGEVKMGNKRKQIERPSNENTQELQSNTSKSLDLLDKLKASESNLVAPPTSMAARADDDFELIEAEDNPGGVGTPKKVENGLPFPIPPLPTVPLNSYFQYEGNEENVDVDGVEELEEVDIV